MSRFRFGKVTEIKPSQISAAVKRNIQHTRYKASDKPTQLKARIKYRFHFSRASSKRERKQHLSLKLQDGYKIQLRQAKDQRY